MSDFGISIRMVENFDLDEFEKRELERDARLLARFKFLSEAPDYTPDQARDVFYRLLNMDMQRPSEHQTPLEDQMISRHQRTGDEVL